MKKEAKIKKWAMPPMYWLVDPNNDSDAFRRYYIEGFFTQTSSAIAIVASMTISNGILMGWNAFIGAKDVRKEDDAIRYAAQYGNELEYKFAKLFFKGAAFPKNLYQNGW